MKILYVKMNESVHFIKYILSKNLFLFVFKDFYEDNELKSSPIASPSSSLAIKKVSDLESAFDMPERPSPVSVLEPLFSEDDISPANTICEPGKHPYHRILFYLTSFSFLLLFFCVAYCFWADVNLFSKIQSI